jgi:hypothetical protein
MVTDVVGLRRVGTVEDVRVAVGRAGIVRELRRRLVVAQIQAEPEGDPVLEVEGAAGPSWVGRMGGSFGITSRYRWLLPEPGVSE